MGIFSKILAIPKISSWGKKILITPRFASPKATNPATSTQQNDVSTNSTNRANVHPKVTSPPSTPRLSKVDENKDNKISYKKNT